MTEDQRRRQAEESVDRCLDAMIEALCKRDFTTYAAVARASARYAERVGEGQHTSNVLAFPRVGTGASQGGFGGVLAPAFIAGLEGQR